MKNMTVHQISIFVENKSGTLLRVLDLFKEAGVQLIASTISDTVEYGIYRIICSEPTRAYEVLRAAGISASMSEVFAITLDNRPGRAADAVRVITGKGIGISYLYWAERVFWFSARMMPRGRKKLSACTNSVYWTMRL